MIGKKWLLAVATTVMALFAGAPEAAQSNGSASGASVPTSWISYAGLVGRQFQASLMAEDDIAYRFHKFLEDRAVSGHDQPLPPLVVKVWIGQEGQVLRVDFPSLGDAQADEDLRRLLMANPLSEPPPPDMRQPLMLRLRLQFNS